MASEAEAIDVVGGEEPVASVTTPRLRKRSRGTYTMQYRMNCIDSRICGFIMVLSRGIVFISLNYFNIHSASLAPMRTNFFCSSYGHLDPIISEFP